jgi:glycosyltransferase involved in cell wall biosynthesis
MTVAGARGRRWRKSSIPLVDSRMPRHRVLIFAYYFPPLGGGGVQRTLKYVKYLPAEGFDSIVIAGGARAYGLRDRGLVREVPPGTVVIRARALPLQKAQWKLGGALRRAGLSTRLVDEALWPDALVGWLPSAVWHGLRAAREHRPDVLYSTSKPETAHLAALIVHKLTGIPWVADFRDAWTLNPFGPDSARRGPRADASAGLERAVVAHASYVTVVDESFGVLGLAEDDRRQVVIRNGVDPDDLPAFKRSDSSTRFRLSHVGTLYGSRDAAPVFAAIRDLIGRGRLDRDRFELRIVGHASLRDADLDSLPVTFVDYVDHHAAIAEMTSASALLFYQPPQSRGSSGKIYEYLGSGRPVLCVAHPDNLAYRLVDELGGGVCADARDVPTIVRAIERLVGDWHRGTPTVAPGARAEALRRFSRRTLTAELAGVLRAAISPDGTRRSTA